MLTESFAGIYLTDILVQMPKKKKTKYKDTLAQVQKQHGGRLPGKASLIRAKYQEQLVK